MNTKQLAKNYATLTPWERLPLIVAADERGDGAERERLLRSAPRLTFRVDHQYGLGEGFHELAKLTALQLLDLAARHWRIAAVLEGRAAFGDEEDETDRRLWSISRFEAFEFVLILDGWNQLCAELRINGDAFLNDLPGIETVRMAEKVLRKLAFSAEEAADFLTELVAERNPNAPCRVSVGGPEEVAGKMRRYLADCLAEWA